MSTARKPQQDEFISACFHRYQRLLACLRRGGDVRPQLRQEFRRLFSFSRGASECAICKHQLDSFHQYKAAAEQYLILGPGIIEVGDLVSSLEALILDHARVVIRTEANGASAIWTNWRSRN